MNIPNWAKRPRSKHGVIATSRGWVDKKTGEVLRRVNDLENRLETLKVNLEQQLKNAVEYIDSIEIVRDSVEPSSNKVVDMVVIDDVIPSAKLQDKSDNSHDEVTLDDTKREIAEDFKRAVDEDQNKKVEKEVDPIELVNKREKKQTGKRRGRKPGSKNKTKDADNKNTNE